MKNVNDKIKVYLITGVAGFIGANLAKRILNLKNEKIHIIGIDNLNDYYDVKLKEYRLSELQKFDKFEFIKCDISNKEKIEVIRIGLQNTEEITDPSDKNSQVVAGPYHPAFRQLVEGRLWYDAIVAEIKKINVKVMQVKIIANQENINNIIGHKKENISKLKEFYDVDVRVETSEEIKPGKFKIEIEKTYQDFLNN